MSKKAWRLATAGALIITAVTPATIAQGAVQYFDELVLSEYVEGSSNNKAIEIYNGTGKTIDLSTYSLELYTNTNTAAGTTQKLEGTLAHGETRVFVHGQANDALKPLGAASGAVNFNGDDTIVLKNGDTIVDSLGKIAANVKYAENVTLVRKSDNFTRDTNPNDDVNLAGWDKLAIDSFDNLGTHTANHGRDLVEGSLSIVDALQAADGTPLQTEGTFIGSTKNTAFIFDGDKAIAIYPASTLSATELGAYVVVSGERATFNSLPQIGNAQLVSAQGGSEPTPKAIDASTIGADVVGQLVTVSDITIAADATGTNKAVEGYDNFIVRDELNTGVAAEKTYEQLTGIVVVYNGTYQLIPRSAADVGAEVEPLSTKPIADVRVQQTGDVQVEGVITAVIGQTVHIQDDSGAIVLYGPFTFDVAVGDHVVVNGSLTEYRKLLEIANVQLVERKGKAAVPAPKVVTAETLNEAVEGQLVELRDVAVGAENNRNFHATVADGHMTIRDITSAGVTANKEYDRIIGVVQQFDDTYQVLPRSAADLIEDVTVVQPVTASAEGLIAKGSEVTLSTTTEGATIYYTTDGTAPTTASTKYEQPITISADSTIRAIAVKEGLTTSAEGTFTYTVYDGQLRIHHIQGASHTSPMKGKQVKDIEGIVTYKMNIRGSYYALMQTPDALADNDANTSEGIYVYLGTSYGDVAIGDHVKVSGIVDEYLIEGNDGDLLSTQINARNGSVTTIAKNVELPKPIDVTAETLPRDVIDNDAFAEFDPQEDAIDYWESLEGMRVAFDGLKATAPQAYGDISTVLATRQTDTNNGGVLISAADYNADRIHLKAFKANGEAATDFDVSTGDAFSGESPLIGVVGYGFSNYKVYMDEADLKAAFKAGNIAPEKTTIVKDARKLTIANYNIENFSANVSETSDAKAKLIAESFVNNMESPDIIGIVEMQDNDGQTASNNAAANASYERLIKAIEDAGGPTYKYVNIDPVYNQDGGAPGANIRPGFLYNPERVTLKEGVAGDNKTAVSYKDGALSHNPGLINPTSDAFASSRKPIAAEFTFNGEDVLVIANHFNSKGGDTALFGRQQPPILGSEVQRNQIANEVKAFVEAVQADNPKANIVTLGDFNDFEFAKPLEILESAGLVNMIKELPREDRYSYTYQGNSQVLDHILISEHLRDKAAVDALHINADYSSVSGKRASDHDPILVQLDLSEETVEMPALTPFTLKGKQTGKLILTKSHQHVHVEEGFTIKNGIVIKGKKDGMYIRLSGALSTQTVTIEAKFDAPVHVDFADAHVKEVRIEGPFKQNVKLLHAQNVEQIVK